jgi:glutamate/tyrosine decarboxylase-like PLP-dependent enzyme
VTHTDITGRAAEIGLDDDWARTAETGHRMLDEMLEHLSTVRARPVWTAPPATVKRELTESAVPEEGQGLESAYADFKRLVRPYTLGNIHPRFWGWVIGASSPAGMLADMLTGGTNVNVWGAEESAAYAEAQVISWFKKLFGYPDDASGLLVSSGSMANLVALTVARDAAGGDALIEDGLHASAQLVAYCSSETHNSNDKAASILGLGRRHLRKIPVDRDYRLDTGALRTAIAEDARAGRKPFCIIANCGTVNTGQIDDLKTLRAIADEHRLWLHVDGAFGALLALSPQLRSLTNGIDAADSIAFDLHKWMNMPYDVACVLVRDAAAHSKSFSPPANYLTKLDGGVASGPHHWGHLGPDLSRGARGLKVWLLLKTFGIGRFARIIEQNVAQAHHLGARIERTPQLELLTPVVTNCVCFRYRREGLDEDALNTLNRQLLVRIQEAGVAVPSSTVLHGKFAIRLAIVNQRSRMHDFDEFVEDVLRIGNKVSVE